MRIALVVQRCGREVNGGAELHCLELARHLAPHVEVEVLTTCALDYVTWADHYPPGLEEVDGVPVRRFPVNRPRNIRLFNALSRLLAPRKHRAPLILQKLWMRLQGPTSSALQSHVREQADTYDFFLFFTYLYACTWDNLPLVAHKAVLAPLAHDEWPIHMRLFEKVFALPRAFLFNTHAEREFLRRRFPQLPLEGPVVGAGIDPPENLDPGRFREKYGIEAPYLLYVGRIDPSKGCGELFDYFLRLRENEKSEGPQKLVLLGKPVMELPHHPDILALGFVDEQDKWDAMAGCEWLVNPSPHESLSFVLLEAWHCRRPVLVTQRCEVLVDQCRRSGGGLAYENFDDFARILRETDAACRQDMGRKGAAFVAKHYDWQGIVKSCLNVFKELEAGA